MEPSKKIGSFLEGLKKIKPHKLSPGESIDWSIFGKRPKDLDDFMEKGVPMLEEFNKFLTIGEEAVVEKFNKVLEEGKEAVVDKLKKGGEALMDKALDKGATVAGKLGGFLSVEALESADKFFMSKLELIFKAAAYVIAGIHMAISYVEKAVRRESLKDIPGLKDQVEDVVNRMKRACYKIGDASVAGVFKLAKLVFVELFNVLPDNKVFRQLKKFSGLISKILDPCQENIKQFFEKRIEFVEKGIKEVEEVAKTSKEEDTPNVAPGMGM